MVTRKTSGGVGFWAPDPAHATVVKHPKRRTRKAFIAVRLAHDSGFPDLRFLPQSGPANPVLVPLGRLPLLPPMLQ
jgi:hypothetical protein